MRPPALVSLKWLTISGVMVVPGMPKTSREPTSCSRDMALIIQEKRLSFARKRRVVGSPGLPQTQNGLTVFDGLADGIGSAQNINRKFFIFVFVRRWSPTEGIGIEIVAALNNPRGR